MSLVGHLLAVLLSSCCEHGVGKDLLGTTHRRGSRGDTTASHRRVGSGGFTT